MPRLTPVPVSPASHRPDLRNPALVLLDDTDPQSRARAHTVLGERALARKDFDTAEEHLREAVDLDPTDEKPKQLLRELPHEPPPARGIAAWIRGLRKAVTGA